MATTLAEMHRQDARHAANEQLRQAVRKYISEYDNPVPDYNHRRTLRNHLRELAGCPPEPKPRSQETSRQDSQS